MGHGSLAATSVTLAATEEPTRLTIEQTFGTVLA